LKTRELFGSSNDADNIFHDAPSHIISDAIYEP
jgi:hypothetical protein